MRNKGVHSQFRKLYWAFLSEVLKGYSWLLGVSPNGTKFVYYSPHDYLLCDFERVYKYADKINSFISHHSNISFDVVCRHIEEKFTLEQKLEPGLVQEWRNEFGIDLT